MGFVRQGQGALHVAGVQSLLGLGQEALNRLIAFLLLPGQALWIDLAQQALRAVDAVLRLSVKLPLLLRADLGREHGRRRGRGRREDLLDRHAAGQRQRNEEHERDGAHARYLSGSRTATVVPRPNSDCTSIIPSWSWTIR